MCVCVCVCVCVRESVRFMSFARPPKGDWRRSVSSEYKIVQAKFTDWMLLLQSNLMEETSLKPEALSTNTFINNSC